MRLNPTNCFIMNISNKRKLQQIAFNYSSDIELKESFKKCTAKPHSFLVIDTTLVSDNPLRFRKNLLERM